MPKQSIRINLCSLPFYLPCYRRLLSQSRVSFIIFFFAILRYVEQSNAILSFFIFLGGLLFL